MNLSLFERIGGDAAVEAAVNKFYVKFMQQPEIIDFFSDVSQPLQIEKMRNFLTLALTGDTEYNRDAIRLAHAPLVERGLNDRHLNIFIQIMHESLLELDIPQELVEEFIAVTEEYRLDVLNR